VVEEGRREREGLDRDRVAVVRDPLRHDAALAPQGRPEDVYMLGRMWQWYPALKLKKGQTYRLHLSSMDLVHGFSL
jgi:hypothetical protein